MAQDLFRVSGGFQIDESTQIIEGAGAPSIDAPIGSIYTETTTGGLYSKIAAGSGTDKWALQASKSYVDSANTTITNNLNAEITARTAADAALQSSINIEVTARTAADQALTSALAVETTARISADVALQSSIDAEVTARTAADQTLTSGLAAEVTARVAADQALNDRIDALGNAFNYVGVLTGGASAGAATDLTALPTEGKNPGDYYKVTTAGYFNDGTTTFFKNIGDGLVWNIYGQMDSIDNTNSQVQGTASEIAVTGTADTGYVVGLDSIFTNRVSTLESNLVTETTARTAADATLQANINAEVTARTAADQAIQNSLTALTTSVDRDGKITTADSVQVLSDTINVPVVAVQWIVHVQETLAPTKVSAYEIFATSNGSSVDFTRFGILKLDGGATDVVVTAVINGSLGIDLSVTTSINANIKIKRVAVV